VKPLKIGISARIYHPDPAGKGVQRRTLQYLEQSVTHWVMSRDVLVFMVPSVDKDGLIHRSNIRLSDYVRHLDGLVLQGGADVAPESYGEEASRPDWKGDRIRDVYEMELVHEFMEAKKPVLGICRGAQLINVVFGGTLSIRTSRPTIRTPSTITTSSRTKRPFTTSPSSRRAGSPACIRRCTRRG